MTATTIIFVVSPEDAKDVDAWFSSTRPDMNNLQRIAQEEILAAGQNLALAILRSVPRCADRSAAIRKVREATATAVEGIVSEAGAYLNRSSIRNG